MDQEAFFTSPIAGLYTLNDLARECGVPLAEMIATVERLRLPPTKRRGVVRLWDDAALRVVRENLKRA